MWRPGAFMAALIGVTRRLTWSGAIEAINQTVRITPMIFAIIISHHPVIS
jgi:TRAP-type mannitol/chloroaromatic compound transport system permease large subunit